MSKYELLRYLPIALACFVLTVLSYRVTPYKKIAMVVMVASMMMFLFLLLKIIF
jgi:hypothetical protein